MTETYNSEFVIPICLIKIWTPSSDIDTSEPDNCDTMLTEVGSIEINDSYKQFFKSAVLKFPRGTIIRRTITKAVDESNPELYAIQCSRDNTGVIVTKRTTEEEAKLDHFAVGNRIKIWLGYTTDPSVAAYGYLSSPKSIYNSQEARNIFLSTGSMRVMFDGYITKRSIDYPIEIRCEDMAYILRRVNCKPVQPQEKITVNDLFEEGGRFDLLKGTGIKLHSGTASSKIEVGGITVTTDMTVADLLTKWTQTHLYAYIKYDNDGNPSLAVGRSYFTNPTADCVVKNEDETNPVEIDFSLHVAENDLKLLNVDKGLLAIQGTAAYIDEDSGTKKVSDRFLQITLMKNEKYDPNDPTSEKYRTNTPVKATKKQRILGVKTLSTSSEAAVLDNYTIMPYAHPFVLKGGDAQDQLIEAMIKYFETVQMTGIEGSLTLFGDLGIKTARLVHLKDSMYPQKNGIYMVDEVTTQFGTNIGYRQKITLPYCISHDNKNTNS